MENRFNLNTKRALNIIYIFKPEFKTIIHVHSLHSRYEFYIPKPNIVYVCSTHYYNSFTTFQLNPKLNRNSVIILLYLQK